MNFSGNGSIINLAMGKKNNKETKTNNKHQEIQKKKIFSELKHETKHSIFAVISLAFGIIFILSYINKAGVAGIYINKILEFFFGNGLFLAPAIFFFAAASFFYSIRPNIVTHTIIGGGIFLISALGAISTIWGQRAGGVIGQFASVPLLKLFDFWVSVIIFVAIAVVSILIMLNMPIPLRLTKEEEETKDESDLENIAAKKPAENIEEKKNSLGEKIAEKIKKMSPEKKSNKDDKDDESADIGTDIKFHKDRRDFTPPPLNILEGDKGKPSSGDIKANANIIKRTLQNFGIDVEMAEINIGPSVTQYTLKPAEGVKLSRIIALQNDLSLALAAHPLRIEAPVPGKSLVGIEIPNSTKTIIGLSSLFQEEEYSKSPLPLLITLGKDVAGKAMFANIAKMPHLLVAGATGSGKSIYIHALIASLLYRNSPETLRFIMVDPKRVELTIYNNIPHMLAPVIIETKKAVGTLKWLCKEMEKRYNTLMSAGVRDIGSYHKEKNATVPMPYLVVIIDELADLMSTYPREMEASIVRLAQMSRAVGIHLVLSTQRPSVEVITGLIKANITSRVALQVASQIDSRTIIDMAGAEKLLGNGDMLYLAGDTAKPRRIQGPYISEQEVKKVVNYLADQYKNTDFDDIDSPPEIIGDDKKSQSAFEVNFEDAEDLNDDLYEEARQTVIEAGKASVSFLQRKLKVGYSRAARIVDMLEEKGVVGPADGSKPRQVLIANSGQLEAEADKLLGEAGEQKPDKQEEETNNLY